MTLGRYTILLSFILPGIGLWAQELNKSAFQQVTFSERKLFSLVQSMAQDEKGFIWIGTSYGLFRYDGYQSRAFLHDPDQPESITDGAIKAIYEDRDHNLWIGTRNGLNRLDRSTGKFIHYLADTTDQSTLSNNSITAIAEDSNGNFWVGTREGLNLLDRENGSFHRFLADPEDTLSISHNFIRSLLLDQEGNFWVGTAAGLNLMESQPAASSGQHKTGFRFTCFNCPDLSFESSPAVTALHEDQKGNLWMGYGEALYRIDHSTGTIRRIPLKTKDSSFTAQVWTIVDDRFGNLWVGTHGDGLFYLPLDQLYEENPVFDRFYPQPIFYDQVGTSIKSSGMHRVWTSLKDREGNIWLGGIQGLCRWEGYHQRVRKYQDPLYPQIVHNNHGLAEDHDGRLFYYDPVKQKLNTIDPKTEAVTRIAILDQNRFPGFKVRVSEILVTRDSNLWLGTYDQGLLFYNRRTGKTRHFYDELQGPHYNYVNTGIISSLCEDRRGHIWIGTWRDGLKRYRPEADAFEHFQSDANDPNALQSKFISSILEDQGGDIWIGTQSGLSRFNPNTGSFIHHFHEPGDPTSISGNNVQSLYEDRLGRLWVGVSGGLNLFNRETGHFKKFLAKNGLAGQRIYDVTEDHLGNIWLATNNGVSRLNPESINISPDDQSNTMAGGALKMFYNLGRTDGLRSDNYTTVVANSRTEELFFIGENGMDYFHPDNLLTNASTTEAIFTSFVRYNLKKNAPIRDDFIADKPSIAISHHDQILTFEIAVLNFRQAENNQYRYHLEGFSDRWYDLGTKREISFSQLSPGNYTLQIMGTNAAGVWHPRITELGIKVRPPWWKTWWAYGIYLSAALVLLFGGFAYERKRYKIKEEAQRLKSFENYKNRLYTNITHEFRTPLTVIQGTAARIETYEKEKEIIQRNSKRLLDLINRMLKLAKLEAGKLQLSLIQSDILPYLSYIIESFHSLALNQKINLNFHTDLETLEMDYDPEKILQILSNLISNAIKFTPEYGKIKITARKKTPEGKPHLEIEVKDTGIGIEAGHLALIFDRFYRVDTGSTPRAEPLRKGASAPVEGTGIGLALTKELVQLLDGSILVESSQGKGSLFTILLPITNKAMRETLPEPMERLPDSYSEPEDAIYENDPGADVLPSVWSDNKQERPRLLIVEDNQDVMQFIASCLQADYQLILARNGRSGIEQAMQHVPDIIISDVMMPEVDGFELCKVLKEHELTNHIPIILLTAKADLPSKLEGLSHGADAYLAKPFHREELEVRLQKLISLRRKLREKYQLGEPGSEDFAYQEDPFLAKARQAILDHLDDHEFGS